MARQYTRRELLRFFGMAGSAAVLAACQPKIVEVEKVVTQVVKETVEVEKIVKEAVEVEKEVTRVIEKVVQVPKEPVEILFMERNTPQDIEFRTELAGRFMKDHPEIKVKLEVIPDGYAQTIQARIAAGTAGDMFRHLVQGGVGKYASRGLFLPIDDIIAAEGFDLSPFFEQGLDSASFGGKLYATPVNGHSGVSGLYYIPELFQEAGIDVPGDDWEYEDLIDASVKLTQDTDGDGKTDQWGLWVPPWYESYMTPLRRHGGWPFNDDATESTWLDPKSVAGMQHYHDLWYKYKVCPVDNTWAFKQDHVGSAKLAMIQSGLWESKYAGDIVPEGFTFKLAPGVKGPSGYRAGSMGVNFFPIWMSSKHPLEAWEFQKYICSREIGVENISRIGEPGLRSDVWEDPVVKNDPMTWPHYALIQEAKRFPAPANARDSENIDRSAPIFDGIRLGDLTVEEGCAELHEKVTEILAMDLPSGA